MTQMKKMVISLAKVKKTFFGAIFLLVALVVLLNMPKPDKSDALAQSPGGKEMPPPLVRVETVGTIDGTQPVPKVAPVMPKEVVELVSRVSGYLEKVAFKEGDYVEKGDLLFEIEDTAYETNVSVAEAVVRQIDAELELAKQNQSRVNRLTPGHTMTQQDKDVAERNVSFQEGRLAEAKAKLEQAQLDLSYTKIYAPLSGRIGKKQFSEGNYLTPQSGVLATIRQFDPITVEFAVSEKEFMTFFQGNGENREAKIEVVMANDQPYEGDFRIDFLDNHVDRNSNTVMVYLICENEDDRLMPGGFSTVKLSEHFTEPRPAANVTALMTDGKSHYVYVVGKDNKLEHRKVTLGDQVYDRQVITSGLTPGEKIVVGGVNKVQPGAVITPLESNPPAMSAEKSDSQSVSPENVVAAQPVAAISQPVPPVAVAQPIGTGSDSQQQSQ